MKAIREAVGPQQRNNSSDVAVVISLLRIRSRQTFYRYRMKKIAIPDQLDPALPSKLATAIKQFQTDVQELKSPDGIVSPDGDTILFLGGVRQSGKQIVVDLEDQNLYTYEGGTRKHSFDSTSGDSDHKTAERPVLFRITRKHEKYTSRKYNAPMNYAMFFSADGKAIHQSNAVGLTSFLKSVGIDYFGSHGCVRLSEDDARTIFHWTPLGTTVFIDVDREGLE